MTIKLIVVIFSLILNYCMGYNILLATMGGTKSHTVPFVALGTALRIRGHNVTLMSAFPGPAANNDLRELVPTRLEVIQLYIINKCNTLVLHFIRYSKK